MKFPDAFFVYFFIIHCSFHGYGAYNLRRISELPLFGAISTHQLLTMNPFMNVMGQARVTTQAPASWRGATAVSDAGGKTNRKKGWET